LGNLLLYRYRNIHEDVFVSMIEERKRLCIKTKKKSHLLSYDSQGSAMKSGVEIKMMRLATERRVTNC